MWIHQKRGADGSVHHSQQVVNVDVNNVIYLNKQEGSPLPIMYIVKIMCNNTHYSKVKFLPAVFMRVTLRVLRYRDCRVDAGCVETSFPFTCMFSLDGDFRRLLTGVFSFAGEFEGACVCCCFTDEEGDSVVGLPAP